MSKPRNVENTILSLKPRKNIDKKAAQKSIATLERELSRLYLV